MTAFLVMIDVFCKWEISKLCVCPAAKLNCKLSRFSGFRGAEQTSKGLVSSIIQEKKADKMAGRGEKIKETVLLVLLNIALPSLDVY